MFSCSIVRFVGKLKRKVYLGEFKTRTTARKREWGDKRMKSKEEDEIYARTTNRKQGKREYSEKKLKEKREEK